MSENQDNKPKKQSVKIDPVTKKPIPPGIWYRGPNQYQVRIRRKEKTQRKTFRTLGDAVEWLRKINAEITLGQHQDTSALKGLTVASLVARYRDECMQERKTDREGHIPALLHPKNGISAIRLSDLQTRDIRLWRERMEKAPKNDRLADSTIVKRLNLLSSIFNHAIGEWDVPIINHASAKLVRRPPGADKKRTRRLSPDDEQKLLEAAQKSSHADDYWLIRWSIESACRLSESLSLKWSSINMKEKKFYLERVKNDKYRDTRGPEERPLALGARKVLEEKLSSLTEHPEPSDHVFDVGTSDAFSVRFGRMARSLGISVIDAKDDNKRLTFHDLRHEATSRLAKMIPNHLDLMRFTGHRDMKSLNRYYQPDMADLAALTEED